MSSILKALKKLDREKTEPSGVASKIGRDILVGGGQRQKKSRRVFPLLMVLLLAVVGLVTFFLAGGLSPVPVVEVVEPGRSPAEADTAIVANQATEPEKKSPAASTQPPAIATAADASQTKAPAEKPEVVMETINQATRETAVSTRETAAALKKTAEALRETAVALKGKVVVSKEVVAAGGKKSSLPEPPVDEVRISPSSKVPSPVGRSTSLRSSQRRGSTPTPAVAAVPIPAGARTSGWAVTSPGDASVPELNVTEIHYRENVLERLAVVNDLPVMEGNVIEGAKVDRIFKDRIRFVINGRYHEIKLQPAGAN